MPPWAAYWASFEMPAYAGPTSGRCALLPALPRCYWLLYGKEAQRHDVIRRTQQTCSSARCQTRFNCPT
eukprot:5227310-Pleurochrysis_carterae.AAC.1